MGRHAAPRRWFGRGRTRALLSLGVLATLGIATTTAYWTDEATINAGTIQSGTLDLSAGPTSGAEHLGGTGPNTWSSALLTISNLVPGESIASTFVVRNSGTAALRFNATVRSTSNALTSGITGLRVQVFDNATTATNGGSQSTGNRSGSCTGAQAISSYVSTTASGNVFPADIVLPTTGATRTLCVRAELSSGAGNALQGLSTQVVLTLNALQVNAP